MTDKEMEKLFERVHKDINVFDFNGKNVPRIILGDRKFDDIMSKIQVIHLRKLEILHVFLHGKNQA